MRTGSLHCSKVSGTKGILLQGRTGWLLGRWGFPGEMGVPRSNSKCFPCLLAEEPEGPGEGHCSTKLKPTFASAVLVTPLSIPLPSPVCLCLSLQRQSVEVFFIIPGSSPSNPLLLFLGPLTPFWGSIISLKRLLSPLSPMHPYLITRMTDLTLANLCAAG